MIRRLGFVLAIVALVSGAGLLLRAEPPQEVGSWASIGTAPENRIGAAAVALLDGRTLIAGGLADGTPTDAVVVFDPADSSFATAGQLLEPRAGHTATLLEDGRVLIAGGTVNDLLSGDVEIFDPSTGESTLIATLAQLRTGHAAARFGTEGKVLIAGGTGTDGVLQTAEILDPATGSVSLTGSALNVARKGASATTLIDGRVLIAGGSDGNQDLLSAEIYNPSTDSFQATDTNLDVPRSNHTAVLLPHNNSVLIAGGTSDSMPLATADLFLPAQFPDPFTYGMGQFALTGEMAAPRSGAAGGPHIEGYAFVVGGGQPDAEVYRFATIKTDKDDYPPGQTAIITGSGWEPNEQVTLLFQEDPAVHADYELTVTADGEGNIYHDQWAPEEHDANVRFYLLAFGQQSRRRAQMTFTDSVNVTVDNPPLVWHRTGEVPGGFNVSANGTYTCTPGGGGNNCTAVTNLTITVSGATGSKVVTGLANNANPAAWGPVTLEFRTAPGAGQFSIPALDGRYDVTATLNSSPNSPTPATRPNYFGLDNTAPSTSISCNNATCVNPYAANVQVRLQASDGGGQVSGVASTVYCVDAANACTPSTTYPGGSGFAVPFVAGTTAYVRYFSTDLAGNIETTKSQPIIFAATNAAPVAVDDSATVDEDSSNNVIDVLANDTDADNVSPALPNAGLTVVAVGPASNGTASLVGGAVRYTPNANYCGPDSFTYTVSDDGSSTAGHIDQGAVSIDVICINDVPSFTAGGNVTVLEDSGPYSAAWATGISAGPSNESGQTLNFIVSNNNPSLFSVQPAVSPSGILSFTPAPNAAGNATVDVQVHDSGGTANNGVDTSAKQTFTITVTGVNDEPSFTSGGDVTVLEDSGAYSAGWAGNVNDGDPEVNQTLTFHVSNNNNALFSSQPAIGSTGILAFTPAANVNGSAVVSVYLTDDGGTANTGDDTSPTQTFTIYVTAVNDAPSFTKGGDVTVAEDSGGYSAAGWATGISAGPADESLQALDFIVSNNNPSLFLVQPAVAANGTLTFTPAADENGTATVTVRLHDDGGTANFGVDTSAPQTFTIDVTAVNDPPDADDDNASVPEDDTTGVLVDVLANDTKGPANESGQTLTITFVSTPSHGTAVVESGQIRYKPTQTNYFGPDSFTYTIEDNGQTNGVNDFKSDTATVSITVTPVNDAPANLSLNLSSGSINENTSTTLSGSFTDVETGDSHTVEINWGDGSAVTTVPLGAGVVAIPSTSHTYLDDNPTGTTSDSYTITVKVTDNGQSGSPLVNDFKDTSATTSVTVNNVAPTKTANPFSFDFYTGVATAGVSFSDQGWLDQVSATWAGITGTTGPIGPGLAGPALTGTFTATQTFTGCVAAAIGVRVSDDDTGYFDHTFAAANSLGTYTAAFLAPIKDGVRNVVKHGNVIPVKVEIRDCHGNLVTNRTLSIVLYAGVSSPADVAEGDLVIASSVSSADSGNTMRLADGHYMYNLATKPLTLGFPYTIWIKDGTMTVATAVITTKK